MMGVYTLVFSVLWKRRATSRTIRCSCCGPRGLGVLPGAVQLGTGSLLANAELIKKVWFPRELDPRGVRARADDLDRWSCSRSSSRST